MRGGYGGEVTLIVLPDAFTCPEQYLAETLDLLNQRLQKPIDRSN